MFHTPHLHFAPCFRSGPHPGLHHRQRLCRRHRRPSPRLLVPLPEPQGGQLPGHLPGRPALPSRLGAGDGSPHQQELAGHLQPRFAELGGFSQQGCGCQAGVPDQLRSAVDSAHGAPAAPELPEDAVAPPGHVQHRVHRAEHQAQGAAGAGQHQARVVQTGGCRPDRVVQTGGCRPDRVVQTGGCRPDRVVQAGGCRPDRVVQTGECCPVYKQVGASRHSCTNRWVLSELYKQVNAVRVVQTGGCRQSCTNRWVLSELFKQVGVVRVVQTGGCRLYNCTNRWVPFRQSCTNRLVPSRQLYKQEGAVQTVVQTGGSVESQLYKQVDASRHSCTNRWVRQEL